MQAFVATPALRQAGTPLGTPLCPCLLQETHRKTPLPQQLRLRLTHLPLWRARPSPACLAGSGARCVGSLLLLIKLACSAAYYSPADAEAWLSRARRQIFCVKPCMRRGSAPVTQGSACTCNSCIRVCMYTFSKMWHILVLLCLSEKLEKFSCVPCLQEHFRTCIDCAAKGICSDLPLSSAL